jgi:hypothetical protein
VVAEDVASRPGSPGGVGAWRLAWAVALLVATIVFASIVPELAVDGPDLNDSALHLGLAKRASEALARGESPIDFWHPDVGLGYPVFHHYQHLPHLALVAVHRLLLGAVSLDAIYRWSLGVLLALFPLAMFVAMWRMDFGPVEACCAAMVAPLVSTPALYGLGLESYLWPGRGLYTQLFAAVLAPLAFAEAYRAVRTGRRLALAAALIAATLLSHLVYGYIVCLSTLSLLWGSGTRAWRVVRLAMILTATGFVTSYFLVPAVRDSAFANHSVWEAAPKWDSLGARVVLSALVRGELLDHGRWPILTALALVGLGWAIWRGPLGARLVAGLTIVWTLLYFGRATWGWVIDMLPFSSDIPMHRFIGGFHLFAIPVAACGLAFVLRSMHPERSRIRGALVVVLAMVVLAPAARERVAHVKWSAAIKREAAAAAALENRDLAPLWERLGKLDKGRAYVGLPRWGDQYLRAGAVPLSAFAVERGIDTLGFLWHAMTLAGDLQVWFDPDNETHYRIFGVRYPVFDVGRPAPAFARKLETFGRYALYEVESASYFGVGIVPMAVEVTKRTAYQASEAWLVSALPAANVSPALAIAGHAPEEATVVEMKPTALVRVFSDMKPPSPVGRIVRSAGRWSSDVELERPAAVVLRANFHPGLVATVDGRRVPVFPVTPGFAAVSVPAGAHAVHFRYVPSTHWPWMILGALALLLVDRPAVRMWISRRSA